jgi:hypothetical protein
MPSPDLTSRNVIALACLLATLAAGCRKPEASSAVDAKASPDTQPASRIDSDSSIVTVVLHSACDAPVRVFLGKHVKFSGDEHPEGTSRTLEPGESFSYDFHHGESAHVVDDKGFAHGRGGELIRATTDFTVLCDGVVPGYDREQRRARPPVAVRPGLSARSPGAAPGRLTASTSPSALPRSPALGGLREPHGSPGPGQKSVVLSSACAKPMTVYFADGCFLTPTGSFVSIVQNESTDYPMRAGETLTLCDSSSNLVAKTRVTRDTWEIDVSARCDQITPLQP